MGIFLEAFEWPANFKSMITMYLKFYVICCFQWLFKAFPLGSCDIYIITLFSC